VTRGLLSTFRDMINDAIRICIEEDVHGRLPLRNRIYKEFQERYAVLSGYPYSVAEIAWSIVKKHKKWGRKPVASRLMMKMDSQNYRFVDGILSLPFRKGEPIVIPLKQGAYQRRFLTDPSLTRGSITITESAIFIAFSKVVTPVVPIARVGIDLNEKSAVCSDGSKYDLSEVVRLHTEYAVRRTDFERRHPQDRRLRHKFAGSRREKARIRQILHNTAKRIVEDAKRGGKSIVLERLKQIQQTHLRGNGEGRRKRGRIQKWRFSLLQNYVAHNAAWEGVQVELVNAAWTSKLCNNCGHLNRDLKPSERGWRCPSCGADLDRDLNAAINIERRGNIACLGEVRPGAQGTNEAVKGNETTKAPILQAEAVKSTLRPSKGKPLEGSLGAQNQWLQN